MYEISSLDGVLRRQLVVMHLEDNFQRLMINTSLCLAIMMENGAVGLAEIATEE